MAVFNGELGVSNIVASCGYLQSQTSAPHSSRNSTLNSDSANMPAKFSHDRQQSRTFRVITALLGSGGQGEVYLATDTKLGRSVGI
jgi:hypothetical protein